MTGEIESRRTMKDGDEPVLMKVFTARMTADERMTLKHAAHEKRMSLNKWAVELLLAHARVILAEAGREAKPQAEGAEAKTQAEGGSHALES